MEDFRLSELEQARIDAHAIGVLVLMGKDEEAGPVSTEDYDKAFAQLEEVKYRLANSSDEQLIAEFAGEIKLLEDEDEPVNVDEDGYLTEETLRLTIELDLERAARLHEKILSRDDLPALTGAAAVFHLRQLTDAMGERATVLWELALNHNQFEIQVAALHALESMLLTHHDSFDVTSGQAEKLLVQARAVADELREEEDDGPRWLEG